jgi:hypothetical protein
MDMIEKLNSFKHNRYQSISFEDEIMRERWGRPNEVPPFSFENKAPPAARK